MDVTLIELLKHFNVWSEERKETLRCGLCQPLYASRLYASAFADVKTIPRKDEHALQCEGPFSPSALE